MSKIHDLGKKGEALAASYLIKRGYLILHRNYRYLKAEIDIIARWQNLLVIVEVKTRHEHFYEEISEAIKSKKKRLMVLAADHFVNENEMDVEVRFDIVSVIIKSQGFHIEHLQDAFYHF